MPNSSRGLKRIKSQSQTKNVKTSKQKQGHSNLCKPLTRSSTNSEIGKLNNEHKEILSEVNNLVPLSKNDLLRAQTKNTIRPCICLQNKYKLMTKHEWKRSDIYSKFYLNRVRETGLLYECPIDSGSIPDFRAKRFQILCILAHTTDSEGIYDYFIVQFLPYFPGITEDIRFRDKNWGEISIQPRANLRDHPHLALYENDGPQYFEIHFKSCGDSESFNARKIKQNMNNFDSLPNLNNDFDDCYGESFKCLNRLLNDIPYPDERY